MWVRYHATMLQRCKECGAPADWMYTTDRRAVVRGADGHTVSVGDAIADKGVKDLDAGDKGAFERDLSALVNARMIEALTGEFYCSKCKSKKRWWKFW